MSLLRMFREKIVTNSPAAASTATDGDSDSDFMRGELKDLRTHSEAEMESALQRLAHSRYEVDIKAAVFKRVKPDRGHILAMIRLQGTNTLDQDPLKFLKKLVDAYNADADVKLFKHIDYACWGTMPMQAQGGQYAPAAISLIRREAA